MSSVAASEAARRGLSRTPQHHPATWIVTSNGNDVWWRATAPAQAVGGKLLVVRRQPEIDRVFEWPNTSKAFPWSITASLVDGTDVVLETKKAWKEFTKTSPLVLGTTASFPTVEGTVIFNRPDAARSVLAKAMRAQGIRTVAETDDNYFCDPSKNIFLRRQEYDDAGMEGHAKSMAQHDANVFSTTWLRDRYLKEYRARFGKKGLPAMYVCRNHVPRDEWPERAERDGPLRVGFMGSPSHIWDVNLAHESFRAARDLGCETWMVGYNPADPDPGVIDTITDQDGKEMDLRSPRSRDFITKWARVISRAVAWIEPVEYHRTALPFDIGIAPLLFNDFTQGKSDVKAIEYTISGAAVVCSNHPVYNTAGWVHGVNCLMGGSEKQLGEQTVRLIRDAGLRYSLVEAAQDMVYNQRNEDTLRLEWEAVL